MRRAFWMIFLAVLASGCQYYQITDPSSGRRYISDNWVASKSDFTGSLSFHDLCTDQDVVLQSSELKKIGSDEAKADIQQGAAFTNGSGATSGGNSLPSGSN